MVDTIMMKVTNKVMKAITMNMKVIIKVRMVDTMGMLLLVTLMIMVLAIIL